MSDMTCSYNGIVDPDSVSGPVESANSFSKQVGGNHYKNNAIQPVQYILANDIGFCEGNVIKYITRWKEKNGLEDLFKARHYIDFLIDDYQSRTK